MHAGRTTTTRNRAPLALVALALVAGSALAQKSEQIVKPPKYVLWMDVSTGSMTGMPDMEMPGMGAMLGGLMGGQGDAKSTSKAYYGAARSQHVSPPRILDVALWNSVRPGVEAAQRVPAGLGLGEALPLLPVVESRVVDPGGRPLDGNREFEQPKGRLLFYWGCGSAVRPGQPRVLDLAKLGPQNAQAFGNAFAGRYAPDRGAKVRAGYDVFPNERDTRSLPKGASLVGEHRITGDGLPDSFRFQIGATQDLMPAIELQSQGTLQDSVALRWAPVTNARAYFLQAMATRGDDMIFWSSSEVPDAGFELFTYLSNATIDKWTQDKVLLDASATQCAVPQAIFAPQGAATASPMLRMIAYGSEHSWVHPPRPANVKTPWEQEWAVRLRVKSQTMALLGEELHARRPAAEAAPAAAPTAAENPPPAQEPSAASLKNALPGAVNLLKGLLGR